MIRHSPVLLLTAMLGVTLYAFAQAQDQPKPADQKNSSTTVPAPIPAPATGDPNYQIGPNDTLNVSVWKEAELSGTVPVRPDGKISVPLLDDVQAAGLTTMQLSSQIADRLRKYVSDPRVTVIVTAINSRRVYVLGEVNHPGGFSLLPDMTVLQVISDAGGLTQFARGKKIYVLRSEEGKQVKYAFNYDKVLKGENPEQNIALKAGDTIVVP